MIKDVAQNLVKLKQEFTRVYEGSSHIQEIIPISRSEKFPFDEKSLEFLHLFVQKNPIYYNSFEQKILDVNCIVYEGDINKYWLNSIQQGSSFAPFSPTWILSAYISSLMAKTFGYQQVIDIGSGDGRIAYCSKILDLESFSIEIDEMLVDLQNQISESTMINFNPNCSNAVSFDYSSLQLTHPIFFIGGLAQMGGITLASGVIEKIQPNLPKENTGIVFVGTFSQKYATDPMNEHGWGTLIDKYHLKKIDTIVLPTVWTFKELDDTPYIFTKFNHK